MAARMSGNMISLAVADGVAHVALTQAARGNALSTDLVEALVETLSQVFDRADVHTLALSGEGRHFCTGFDLDGLESHSDGDLLQRFVRIEMMLAQVWNAPIRTVALATGRTWGAGADLFAACDVRLAFPQTRLRFPGAAFGLVLGTRRLAARVGGSTARRWVTTGAEISAENAHAAGLVTDLLDEGQTLAAWLKAEPAPGVDRLTLAALNRASRADDTAQDLAALARSAARPGLRDRIATYAGRRART